MTEPVGTSEEGSLISDKLRELLVCPIDKAALDLTGSALVCTECGRTYPIENGIPNMLVNEAT